MGTKLRVIKHSLNTSGPVQRNWDRAGQSSHRRTLCRESRLVKHLPAVGHVNAAIPGGICLRVPRICAGLGIDYICPSGQTQ